MISDRVNAICAFQNEGGIAAGEPAAQRIELPEGRYISVICDRAARTLSISVCALPAHLSEPQRLASMEALLRLGADGRMTDGSAGALRPDGSFAVQVLLHGLEHDADVIDRMLERLERRVDDLAGGHQLAITNSPPAPTGGWVRI